MAPHSSTLAWKIPWTEEPGGLQSMGSLRVRLSDFTFTFHFHSLESEMATHSGVLAWRIPGTGEPGGMPSMGSHRVGHDWSDLAVAVIFKGFSCYLTKLLRRNMRYNVLKVLTLRIVVTQILLYFLFSFLISFDFVQNDFRPPSSLQGSELDIIALLFQLLREEIS